MEGFEELGYYGWEGSVGFCEKEDGVLAVFEAEREGGLVGVGFGLGTSRVSFELSEVARNPHHFEDEVFVTVVCVTKNIDAGCEARLHMPRVNKWNAKSRYCTALKTSL